MEQWGRRSTYEVNVLQQEFDRFISDGQRHFDVTVEWQSQILLVRLIRFDWNGPLNVWHRLIVYNRKERALSFGRFAVINFTHDFHSQKSNEHSGMVSRQNVR